MRSCCCVAQCPACGQCCQVPCGHRSGMGTYTAPNTSPPAGPWPPGQITIMPKPLTEEDVRRVIREEIERGRGAS